jgi:prepilin-type processing-associated H-X9-DG protein
MSVEDSYAGKQVKCPACGKDVLVPASGGVAVVMPLGPAKTSGLAIASLVLGITGILCGVTAIPGLILGIAALARIGRSQGRLTGKGLAIAGTCVSAAWLILVAMYVAMMFPAVSRVRAMAKQEACMANVKQLGMAMMAYEADKGKLPSASDWCDSLCKDYVSNDKAFQCLELPNQRCAYGFNASLSGKGLYAAKQPERTVLLFETDGGWNVSGGRERMISKPRHPRGYNILFADSHVETVPEGELGKLVWTP